MGVGEVGSERGAEERVVVVCDPVMELKEKLEEAKAKKVTFTCFGMPFHCIRL